MHNGKNGLKLHHRGLTRYSSASGHLLWTHTLRHTHFLALGGQMPAYLPSDTQWMADGSPQIRERKIAKERLRERVTACSVTSNTQTYMHLHYYSTIFAYFLPIKMTGLSSYKMTQAVLFIITDLKSVLLLGLGLYLTNASYQDSILFNGLQA